MPKEEFLTSSNGSGIYESVVYVSKNSTKFVPLMLLTLFFMFSIVPFLKKQNETGRADLISYLASGSFVVTIIAITMSFFDGLINNFIVVICCVITGIFAFLLLLPKSRE